MQRYGKKIQMQRKILIGVYTPKKMRARLRVSEGLGFTERVSTD